MGLKAVLFDFNGVILDDEPLHQEVVEDLLLCENLRPNPDDYRRFCLGRSDRVCLKDVLASRGRVVTEAALETLLANKAQVYRQRLRALETLPLFPDLEDLLLQLRATPIKLAVVSGALRAEITEVLKAANLINDFPVIVAAEDIPVSKPEPDGYWLAIERLNQKYPTLHLQPQDCLAIEDCFAGIEAAKRAGISVVGVAHTYPLHMLQRCANWAIDYLYQLEVERVQQVFAHRAEKAAIAQEQP